MISLFRQAYNRWSADDGSLMAAAIAYYLAIAFIPLLLVLLSGLGLFFQWTQSGQNAEMQILQTIEEQLSPALRTQVEAVFSQIRDKASISGPIGLITFLAAALVLFTQFESAFDRIWNVPQKERGFWESLRHVVIERARAFLMLTALGIIVIAVFLSGMVVSGMLDVAGETLSDDTVAGQWIRWSIQLLVSFVLNWLVFTCMYRFVPKTRVAWKSAAAGGFCAASIWEIGRILLSAIVIGKKYSAYGVLGAFLAIMLWAYYAVSVIFFGAEFAQSVSNSSDKSELSLADSQPK